MRECGVLSSVIYCLLFFKGGFVMSVVASAGTLIPGCRKDPADRFSLVSNLSEIT